MSQELIPLWGYRTGTVENARGVRHALAFDLTRVDLRERVLVSAAVRLPDLTSLPLPVEALGDLQAAAGGFFSVDALFEDASTGPQPLDAGERIQLLVVAELPASAVAAAA